ncbi:bifunctional ADP-dependent NAD(P)H-hydrate dehydratase/NAD(P)H-hydrate epimerase [Tatumella terrea]|uniref:NAD(P)H-hydrate dehydratase n=1 Tax=Tatumella terrea TaxID=419007 RepID=UPI0031E36DC2
MSEYDQDLSSSSSSVWPVKTFPELERALCESRGITCWQLMQQAGMAAFTCLRQTWPEARHLRILCGSGNNGGDGYILATLASMAGYTVSVMACDQKDPPAEAAQAREQWLACGGECQPAEGEWIGKEDLIVDALLGIGLNRAPEDPYLSLIEKTQQRQVPILALDIPSGVMADSGAVPGAAIKATVTLSFIALKAGLLTGKARDYCGKVMLDLTGPLPAREQATPPAWRRTAGDLSRWLQPRQGTAHKGNNGRLVLIGGAEGTGGAIRLAAEAALRSGAGLARVLTHAKNVSAILSARPELMVAEASDEKLKESLEWADIVVIGPGLGQSARAREILNQVKKSKKDTLWDADALNLLAIDPDTRQNRILTPHPGEAARLLGVTVSAVEHDRLQAARELTRRYGGVAVLKGAGTVIAASGDGMTIADVGNPGMATGGMGDVLSGVIAALAGQKLSLYDAACAGVIAHGAAADAVASEFGMRGMLASDLFLPLRRFVNPDMNVK